MKHRVRKFLVSGFVGAALNLAVPHAFAGFDRHLNDYTQWHLDKAERERFVQIDAD